MAKDLFRITGPNGPATANIVFVHGLGGHPLETWQILDRPGTFWPTWLGEDQPGLTIWTFGYAAPHTNWSGNGLHLTDRAVNAFERLVSVDELFDASIIFVGHSLGGLLIKQILRLASDQSSTSVEAEKLIEATKGVVFVSTPHAGASIATLADRLRSLVWPSANLQDLMRNDANLRDLNTWFRLWKGKPPVRSFYETIATEGTIIVDAVSADGGVSNLPAVPIQRDHIRIAKVPDRDDLVYVRTLDFIRDTLRLPPVNLAVETEPLPKYVPEGGHRNPIPILLRLIPLLLVAAVIAWLLLRPAPRQPEPITDLTASVSWWLPTDFPGGGDLVKRLEILGDQVLADVTIADRIEGISVNGWSAGSLPNWLSIEPDSSFYPTFEGDTVLFTLIDSTGADVSCFQTAQEADAAARALDSEGPLILGSFGHYGDYAFSIDGGDQASRMSYNISEKQILIAVDGPIPSDQVRKNGDITSLGELEASTCLLVPSHLMSIGTPQLDAELFSARGSIAAANVSISASGRTYSLHLEPPERAVTKGGYVFFRFKFPPPDNP